MFDNFEAVATHIDPGFEIHAAMARFLALAVHHFADAPVPPIDLAAIGPYLEQYARALAGLQKAELDPLLAAVQRFREAAEGTRAGEDEMIAMHGAFLDETGLAGRTWYRNLLVAPGRDLGYGATVMPGIAEALEDADPARVRLEVARVIARIDAATAILSK
jgi:N-acetylated-alpha-linked acidic dipeptidase